MSENNEPIVPVNGKMVDLRKAKPVTIGLLKKVQAIGNDPIKNFEVVQDLLRSAEPALTDEDLDTIPIHWAEPILERIVRLQQEISPPF